MVIKYRRPVIKIKASGQLRCAAAPVGVIEGSRADVSFPAGMRVDKFVYHIPLYRQHQRLEMNGVRVGRSWLTVLSQKVIALFEPIYQAQLASIRASRVLAMDETPIRAGLRGPGKLKAAKTREHRREAREASRGGVLRLGAASVRGPGTAAE